MPGIYTEAIDESDANGGIKVYWNNGTAVMEATSTGAVSMWVVLIMTSMLIRQQTQADVLG